MANWLRPYQWLHADQTMEDCLVDLYRAEQHEAERLAVLLWAFECFSEERWLLKHNDIGILRGVRNVCNGREDSAPLGYAMLLEETGAISETKLEDTQWRFQLISKPDTERQSDQTDKEIPNDWLVWTEDCRFIFQPV